MIRLSCCYYRKALYSSLDYYSWEYRFCWSSYTQDVLMMIPAVNWYSNVQKFLSLLPGKCFWQVMQIWKHRLYRMKDRSSWRWSDLIEHLNMTWIHQIRLLSRKVNHLSVNSLPVLLYHYLYGMTLCWFFLSCHNLHSNHRIRNQDSIRNSSMVDNILRSKVDNNLRNTLHIRSKDNRDSRN